jgi:F420-non-reducing hydrogenase iron-sulfur subunit
MAAERLVSAFSGQASTPAADWHPRIIAFCCNWCAYAGADLAGVNRRQYASEVKILRVMCSGRVSQGMILRAFASGADGVLVLGCHPGDCHYTSGNKQTEKRVPLTQELLDLAGIDPARLMLRWISAAEGELFASTVDEFVARIRDLGPIGGEAHGH